jgi:hypothetical protein
MGPEWQPSRARFLTYDADDGRALIVVDPAHPNAWKDPKYYETLKRRAAERLHTKSQLTLVRSGRRYILILPDRDEALTITSASSLFKVITTFRNGVPSFDVVEEK